MTTNWANQTIWTGDNLPILRGMNSESVGLIYRHPPAVLRRLQRRRPLVTPGRLRGWACGQTHLRQTARTVRDREVDPRLGWLSGCCAPLGGGQFHKGVYEKHRQYQQQRGRHMDA